MPQTGFTNIDRSCSEPCGSCGYLHGAQSSRALRCSLGSTIPGSGLGSVSHPDTDRYKHKLTRSDFRGVMRQLLAAARSEEHTSELQSLMRISYAVFCLKKQKAQHTTGVECDTHIA